MRGVVADVKPRHERVGAALALERLVVVAADPAGAELDQLLVLERLRGAGVAPALVPGLFK
jgi:hypothetical protein